MPRPTILERLAEQLAKPIDDRTRERARWHLLDWLGCAAAGKVASVGGVFLSREGQSASDKAFAWGALGNVLEMDDVDKRALLHPGPSIVPAVLAAGIHHGAELSMVLDAIIRGYQATIQLGRAVGTGHYAIWHNTGTCGVIGAAAGVAAILQLTTQQTAHAMALAMSQAAGLWQTRHEPASMGKQLHTAHASRAGLDAAVLAFHSVIGPLTILEGEQGFFAAMCPGAEPKQVLEASADWLIHDVSFKPWPACRHAHAAIDAALEARSSVDWRDEPITVHTYADAVKFCDQPDPGTTIEAKFSLQHAVAVTLLKGEPALADFEGEGFNDPEIARLRSRVQVEIDERFNSAYPARFGSALTIGDRTIRVDDALGDPENPISQSALMKKALELLAYGGVPPAAATSITQAVMSGTEFSAIASSVEEWLR
ncbi:MAG: MmgE/PrpD family protein [Parvularculaceae bacterium]|nr:MmgE/PrpD family protein [Parvularculaceae bacterium]